MTRTLEPTSTPDRSPVGRYTKPGVMVSSPRSLRASRRPSDVWRVSARSTVTICVLSPTCVRRVVVAESNGLTAPGKSPISSERLSRRASATSSGLPCCAASTTALSSLGSFSIHPASVAFSFTMRSRCSKSAFSPLTAASALRYGSCASFNPPSAASSTVPAAFGRVKALRKAWMLTSTAVKSLAKNPPRRSLEICIWTKASVGCPIPTSAPAPTDSEGSNARVIKNRVSTPVPVPNVLAAEAERLSPANPKLARPVASARRLRSAEPVIPPPSPVWSLPATNFWLRLATNWLGSERVGASEPSCRTTTEDAGSASSSVWICRPVTGLNSVMTRAWRPPGRGSRWLEKISGVP